MSDNFISRSFLSSVLGAQATMDDVEKGVVDLRHSATDTFLCVSDRILIPMATQALKYRALVTAYCAVDGRRGDSVT